MKTKSHKVEMKSRKKESKRIIKKESCKVIVPPLSEIQRKEMIQFMTGHTQFARNNVSKLGWQGSSQIQFMWESLKERINKLPGSNYSPPQLQQKWHSIVYKARQQHLAFVNSARRLTGNTKKQDVHLTPEQEQVCNIFENFGLTSKVLTEEIGFGATTGEMKEEEDVEYNISTNNRSSTEQLNLLFRRIFEDPQYEETRLADLATFSKAWGPLTDELNALPGRKLDATGWKTVYNRHRTNAINAKKLASKTNEPLTNKLHIKIIEHLDQRVNDTTSDNINANKKTKAVHYDDEKSETFRTKTNVKSNHKNYDEYSDEETFVGKREGKKLKYDGSDIYSDEESFMTSTKKVDKKSENGKYNKYQDKSFSDEDSLPETNIRNSAFDKNFTTFMDQDFEDFPDCSLVGSENLDPDFPKKSTQSRSRNLKRSSDEFDENLRKRPYLSDYNRRCESPAISTSSYASVKKDKLPTIVIEDVDDDYLDKPKRFHQPQKKNEPQKNEKPKMFHTTGSQATVSTTESGVQAVVKTRDASTQTQDYERDLRTTSLVDLAASFKQSSESLNEFATGIKDMTSLMQQMTVVIMKQSGLMPQITIVPEIVNGSIQVHLLQREGEESIEITEE